MKKLMAVMVVTLCTLLFSPFLMANDMKIGYVNVTDIYNKSAYVQKANKALQDSARGMEDKLQAEKNKLQELVSSYEKSSPGKKEALAKKIKAAQSHLGDMTQDFQKKIQEQQAAGMQKFTQLIQEAVAKVVKDKHLNAVLNSNAIVYTDDTWIDISKEVESAMQQN